MPPDFKNIEFQEKNSQNFKEVSSEADFEKTCIELQSQLTLDMPENFWPVLDLREQVDFSAFNQSLLCFKSAFRSAELMNQNISDSLEDAFDLCECADRRALH